MTRPWSEVRRDKGAAARPSAFRRLACRALGHQTSVWADNGCYTLHEYSPEHVHLLSATCERCGRLVMVDVERPACGIEHPARTLAEWAS